jgi:hypothetical protein
MCMMASKPRPIRHPACWCPARPACINGGVMMADSPFSQDEQRLADQASSFNVAHRHGSSQICNEEAGDER